MGPSKIFVFLSKRYQRCFLQQQSHHLQANAQSWTTYDKMQYSLHVLQVVSTLPSHWHKLQLQYTSNIARARYSVHKTHSGSKYRFFEGSRCSFLYRSFKYEVYDLKIRAVPWCEPNNRNAVQATNSNSPLVRIRTAHGTFTLHGLDDDDDGAETEAHQVTNPYRFLLLGYTPYLSIIIKRSLVSQTTTKPADGMDRRKAHEDLRRRASPFAWP